MRKLIFFFTLILALPYLALAHDLNYFEYAPDPFNSARLTVAAFGKVAERFQILSPITLTGLDLWIDNPGTTGEALLTLRGDNNVFLAAKTVTIPSLAPVPGGNKLHIDLDQDILLNPQSLYALEIESSLVGFGLYHAKRVVYLEHNREFVSPYILGVATLDDEEQTYSFKYALYREAVFAGGGGSVNPPGDEEPPADASGDSLIAITNARIASVTHNSATIAWTTNIAADSRVSIRTQLNPLYVYTMAYDPTLELEHTMTVGGLAPEVNYFANVFSAQNELLLSTYTLGFQTAAAPPPPAENPSETPINDEPTGGDTNEPPITEPGQNNATSSQTNSNSNDNNATSTSTAASSSLPAPAIDEGTRDGNFALIWNAPVSGEPANGYRIDVFNKYNQLERQFNVPAGEHSKEISQLASGEYRAVVYANNDGVFEKVAVPFAFLVKSRANKNIWLGLSIIVVLFGASLAFVIWRFRREKSALPIIEE